MEKPTCQFEDCDDPSRTRGYCRKHYQRLRNQGAFNRIRHLLSEMDVELLTALCAVCGPTTLVPERRNERKRWKCATVAVRDRTKEYARTKDRRLQRLEVKYGLLPDQLENIIIKQKGKCMICKKLRPWGGREGLVVDHDHTTGRFRGLLCGHCNSGIGMFHDNPATLQAAIRYLRETAQERIPGLEWAA